MSAGNGKADPSLEIRGTFENLVEREYADLVPGYTKEAGRRDPDVATTCSDGEPWVKFTSENLVGLALSGGGIRSATFNLGLLQALEDWKFLKHVDYLATVSGGGYIGGFWTRWRARRHAGPSGQVPGRAPDRDGAAGRAEGSTFPSTGQGWAEGTHHALPGLLGEGPESAQIRHLREFGRFLIPRRGLNSEFWQAVVAILSGLVPSLVIALGTVVLLTAGWALATHWLVNAGGTLTVGDQVLRYAVVVGLLACIYAAARTFVPAARDAHPYASAVAVILILVGGSLGCWLWAALIDTPDNEIPPSPLVAGIPASPPPEDVRLVGVAETLRQAGAPDPMPTGVSSLIRMLGDWLPAPTAGVKPFAFDWRLMWPCCATVGAITALTLLRDFLRRGLPDRRRPFRWIAELDHAIVKVFEIQMIWMFLVALWEFARWLFLKANSDLTTTSVGAGGVSAVLAMVFFWLRDWLKENKESKDGSWWSKAAQIVKPMMPRLLAGGIVVMLFLLADIFLIGSLRGADETEPAWVFWRIVAVSSALGFAVCLFIRPDALGLHEFYRGRIARCYLGAAAASPTRQWPEQAEDDMYLKEDQGKPLHLICCAANQCCGDPMGTLHRGARSAVLSRHGIALGNHFVADDSLHLSTAMTASAAALNSLMGEFNVTMGRAVPFVMTALNMRLGRWLRNPAAHLKGATLWKFNLLRILPGLHYLSEMAGRASCGTCGRVQPFIHLSDGGHFENLALYELIRRHCRYILVSDAAQDREFAFDDLGRAVRRVREDFGVEIEIELQPLRPGETGRSEQHVAVGVIHYDGRRGTDKGVLVYLKPTLTGNESVDVLQYQKAFAAFPHESTQDQFFDEAQFESYRRLGQHTVDSALTVEGIVPGDPAERLFHKLRLHWQKVPWMHTDASVLLCEHAADLERDVGDARDSALRQDFFGEVLTDGLGRMDGPARERTNKCATDLWLVLRTLKFMEEVLVTCELDRHWSNPRARSWMSYLQRYAAMPVVRTWWPLLKPLLGADFIRFADSHLFLATAVGDEVPATCRMVLHLMQLHVGSQPEPYFARRLHECRPEYPTESRELFGLFLEWIEPEKPPPVRVQVGLASIGVKPTIGDPRAPGQREPLIAFWRVNDIFIPPELDGGDDFRRQLIERVVRHYETRCRGVSRLEVDLGDVDEQPRDRARPTRRGKAFRQELIEHIGLYRSLGFKFNRANVGSVPCMIKRLASSDRDGGGDTETGTVGMAEAGRIPDLLFWNVHARHVNPAPGHIASRS